MINLSKQQIISMHDMLIRQTGGLEGLRDENLLDSALNTPYQTFDGVELYPTVQKKAVCLCFGLVNNHPFNDGNKRIGVLAMLTFMGLNGMVVQCTDDELVDLGLSVASGKCGQKEILDWLMINS